MSHIQLYKSKYLQKGKNFLIESFTDYLSSISSTSLSVDNFQYIRPLRVITVKLDLSQQDATPYPASAYNYLDLQPAGTEDSHYYYFIVHKVQKAVSTIELTCEMDTLNTFKWNNDYLVDSKTLVMREHKDRIVDNEVDDDVYQRNIDLRSEGINAPLYKKNELKILQDEKEISWILYYRNKDNYDAANPNKFTLDNPVECFIAPSFPIKARYGTIDTTITATQFTTEGYYYISGLYWAFEIGGVVYQSGGNFDWEIRKKSNGKIDIRKCVIVEQYQPIDNWEDIYIKELVGTDLDDFEVLNPIDSTLLFKYWATSQSEPHSGGTSVTITISPTTVDFYLDPANIDRTDSRNIKIIELPYAPTSIGYDEINDTYLFDGSWVYDASQKLFKLRSFDSKFTSTFKSIYSQFWDNLLVDGINDATSADLRDDKFESKIYHSDFYRPKFVFDSFYLNLEFEKIDFDSWWTTCQSLATTRFVIEFTASRNVISKFMFKFPQYITKYGQMDFDNICVVSRNNEQVIYNSTYLNYIRNGYNYDLKSKQRNEETGGIGLGLSIGSTILGVIGGIATQNYGMAILTGVGGMLTIANQSINYAKSVAQAEQNIQQKLQDAKAQAVSVGTADDIDLLNAYCSNKAKMCWYEVSDTMKKALLDVFYYSGYETNERKTPDITTRYWFNYLQCELVIEPKVSYTYFSEEIIEDIKARFKEGVTFFHKQGGTWDLDQLKENYESWILS